VSTRIAAILAALVLAGGAFWLLSRPSGPGPRPDDAAALAPATPDAGAPQIAPEPEPEATEPEPGSAARPPARQDDAARRPGVRPAPGPAPAAAPEGSMWSRLSDQVRRFLTPSSFDKDEDGRMDSEERESARDLIQQRRNRAREEQR
jgi:hypothetical protein